MHTCVDACVHAWVEQHGWCSMGACILVPRSGHISDAGIMPGSWSISCTRWRTSALLAGSSAATSAEITRLSGTSRSCCRASSAFDSSGSWRATARAAACSFASASGATPAPAASAASAKRVAPAGSRAAAERLLPSCRRSSRKRSVSACAQSNDAVQIAGIMSTVTQHPPCARHSPASQPTYPPPRRPPAAVLSASPPAAALHAHEAQRRATCAPRPVQRRRCSAPCARQGCAFRGGEESASQGQPGPARASHNQPGVHSYLPPPTVLSYCTHSGLCAVGEMVP